MNILAISTSTETISICVQKEQGAASELNVKVNKKHSTVLLSVIDDLLKLTDTDISEIDLFACDSGPGSFTGIRIGVSTINAMALAGKKPAVGVSSLDILASGVYAYGKIIASCIYARNDQVYGGIYSGINAEARYFAGSIDGFLELFRDISKDSILFVGDGGVVFREKIADALPGRACFSEAKDNMVKASQLAVLASGRRTEAGYAVPFYLKNVSAKESSRG